MPRDLSDIIRDPQPDPHRQFDKKVERLVETPTEKACREFGENIRAFAEVMKDLQGELEQEVETAHGVIVKMELEDIDGNTR